MNSTRISAVLLMLLLVSPATAVEKAELRGVGEFEVPKWFKKSFLDLRLDVRQATEEGIRVMLYFGQAGCPYCAEFFNNNYSQKKIVDYTQRHFDAIEINIWGDREVTDFSGKIVAEKKFATDLKIWFTPTILFLNERNGVAFRINGYYPPHRFLAALKYVAGKHEKKMSFHEYYDKHSPTPTAGKLHTQSFFIKQPYRLAGSKRRKPLAVFFEQKNCMACDHLHSNVFTQPATLDQLKRFDVVQLDRRSDVPVITPAGDKTTARAWANKLNIGYSPSAVLFDRGKEVIRIEALLKAFHVQSLLDYVASGAYREESSLQRYIGERADRLREQGIVVDIWQ